MLCLWTLFIHYSASLFSFSFSFSFFSTHTHTQKKKDYPVGSFNSEFFFIKIIVIKLLLLLLCHMRDILPSGTFLLLQVLFKHLQEKLLLTEVLYAEWVC